MIKVVESFSGIGSQHRALKNLEKKQGIKYEILNTIEWDINAIYAYDLIHNGPQLNNRYQRYTKDEVLEQLSKYTLSMDGKNPASYKQLSKYTEEALKAILFAIYRTNNLVDIKEVSTSMIDKEIDIFTYSFPCQDLSLSGFFHGDKGGISRDAKNSSSMLWEVERILLAMDKENKRMPKFLIMENVASIISKKHEKNFKEWIESLKSLGYCSKYGHICAENLGVPQKRKRTFMISVYHGGDEGLKQAIEEEFNRTLNFEDYQKPTIKNSDNLRHKLRLDYTKEMYKNEAIGQVPNYTKSREKIFHKNDKILNEKQEMIHYVRTITTKQDRHPNSGTIWIDKEKLGLPEQKANFRFLTPRETFLLMGYEEKDFDVLLENNLRLAKNRYFFTKDRLHKLAGNSIVVDVMEEVFDKVIKIKNNLKL